MIGFIIALQFLTLVSFIVKLFLDFSLAKLLRKSKDWAKASSEEEKKEASLGFQNLSRILFFIQPLTAFIIASSIFTLLEVDKTTIGKTISVLLIVLFSFDLIKNIILSKKVKEIEQSKNTRV